MNFTTLDAEAKATKTAVFQARNFSHKWTKVQKVNHKNSTKQKINLYLVKKVLFLKDN